MMCYNVMESLAATFLNVQNQSAPGNVIQLNVCVCVCVGGSLYECECAWFVFVLSFKGRAEIYSFFSRIF